MTKKISVGALGALVVLAACADGPTGLGPDMALEKKFDMTGSGPATPVNGPVWVHVEFTIAAGVAVAPGINQHPQFPEPQGGTCRKADGNVSGQAADNTFWFNQAGHVNTSAKFCQGSAGDVARTCDAVVPATYAAAASSPGSGNENLNFLTDEEGDVEDLFVHYKSNKDWTDATGDLEFSFTCSDDSSGEASLDLSQFATGNPDGGNTFRAGPEGDRRLDHDDLVISSDLGSGGLDGLHWFFRSRVGE